MSDISLLNDHEYSTYKTILANKLVPTTRETLVSEQVRLRNLVKQPSTQYKYMLDRAALALGKHE